VIRPQRASRFVGRLRSHLAPIALAAFCLLVLLGLSSCGGARIETSSQASTPVKGGVLRLVGQPQTLDPAAYSSMDEVFVDHCIYETLFGYPPGPHMLTSTGANAEFAMAEAGTKLEPGLAAEMPKVSDDGKVYRITLRDDSRFAPPVDRPVTATDVQYSFERMLRDPLAIFTYFYGSIDGVDEFIKGDGEHVRGFTVVDPQTIEIRLTHPDPTIAYAFANASASVVPREWVEKWGKKFGQHPLGSGPFKFVEWPQASKVALERNPNYHDAEHVWLDGVEFIPYSIKLADMMKVQRGALDVCWLNQADWVKARNDPTWKRYMTEQLQLQTYQLIMNAQMAPFDDVRVRQAFSWAIDRERLAKIAGCDTMWQIFPKGMPGFVEGAKFYGFDPAKARALLAEAGYPNGLEVTLYLPGDSDFDSRMAQAMQQDLKQSGIRAQLEMRPQMAYYPEQATPNTYALSLGGWAPDYPDPYAWIKPLFTRDAAVKDGSNCSFWWDPRVERMLADAQSTLDPDERIAKFSEIQAVVSDGAPIVPVWQMLSATLNSPETGGFFIHPLYFFDPEHYWKQAGETD
jgi:ABC-type transport system substrate-binding protein